MLPSAVKNIIHSLLKKYKKKIKIRILHIPIGMYVIYTHNVLKIPTFCRYFSFKKTQRKRNNKKNAFDTVRQNVVYIANYYTQTHSCAHTFSLCLPFAGRRKRKKHYRIIYLRPYGCCMYRCVYTLCIRITYRY